LATPFFYMTTSLPEAEKSFSAHPPLYDTKGKEIEAFFR